MLGANGVLRMAVRHEWIKSANDADRARSTPRHTRQPRE
jgi:hypothetical protein